MSSTAYHNDIVTLLQNDLSLFMVVMKVFCGPVSCRWAIIQSGIWILFPPTSLRIWNFAIHSNRKLIWGIISDLFTFLLAVEYILFGNSQNAIRICIYFTDWMFDQFCIQEYAVIISLRSISSNISETNPLDFFVLLQIFYYILMWFWVNINDSGFKMASGWTVLSGVKFECNEQGNIFAGFTKQILADQVDLLSPQAIQTRG